MRRYLTNSSKVFLLLSDIWQEALENKKSQQIHFVLNRKKFGLRDLKRLHERGFLNFKQEGGGFLIDLTKDGLIQAAIAEIEKALPFDSDDTACIVVFDIPEKFEKERRFFRAFLNRCGFLPIQKSVFITTFDVYKPISDFVGLAGFSNWVRVFVGTEK